MACASHALGGLDAPSASPQTSRAHLEALAVRALSAAPTDPPAGAAALVDAAARACAGER